MPASNPKPMAYSEIVTYWRGVRATLAQRNLLKGEQIPEARALVLPDRAIFVLDMQRLAGIPREKWLDRDLWLQIRAALQGRRAYVADSAGLALVIAREPGTHELKQLPALIELTREHLPSGPYTVTLGYDKAGPVAMDLAGAQRAVLIGGTTGSGKTSGMQTILAGLLLKHTPEELQLAIIDPKVVDFAGWHGLPHLFAPVANSIAEAELLIDAVEFERQERQAAMMREGVRDWRDLADPFPLLVLVVDEAADFAGTDAMATLVEIARKGRAFGVSVILGTQYPTSKVIDPQVKANLDTSIAFRCKSGTESRVILDRNGAEELPRPGLALTYIAGRWRRVQVLWMEEEIIAGLTSARAEAVSSNPLSEIEAQMVQYAEDELEGSFAVGGLYDEFKGEISKKRLSKLGREWEERGWLTLPQHDEKGHPIGRQVTEELAAWATERLAPASERLEGDRVTGVIGGDEG